MKIAIIWFRQDLRLQNNEAFIKACNDNDLVLPIYILDEYSVLGAAQKWWLHYSLLSLKKSLKNLGLDLYLYKSSALDNLLALIEKFKVNAIYWNRCYEPLIIERDTRIKTALLERSVQVFSSAGNLFHEPWVIKNSSAEYFKVFTPYWKQCLKSLQPPLVLSLKNSPKLIQDTSLGLDDFKLLPRNPDWAKNFSSYWQPGEEGAKRSLKNFLETNINSYKVNRNIPSFEGTSKLSPHLHFGELSVWDIWKAIKDLGRSNESVETFLAELGWREFSYNLLYNFPKLSTHNFKAEFNNFPWENNELLLKAWQQGKTGYPIVDAGMRELWQTGYMHNRVRMIVASFLTKDLFIDWRKGAAWFLDTLLDADLASNSASWQWVAGCGADAAPYFRVFNPNLQAQKFDLKNEYIKKWVPEFNSEQYIKPIVEHAASRLKALSYYKALQQK